MARGLVLSGARARLLIDGVKVMYATNVSYSEEITHDPIEVLDQLEVAEFVPTAYRVTFSAQMVRVVTNTVKNRDGVVIFPRLEDILTKGDLTATIEDSQTGNVVANVERVRATRYSNNIGARGIVLTDVEFVAIRIRNESEIS
ncbi:hypothetical protein K0U83_16980 [bacterium]|nr:hypothetical protein [bacterium]